MPRVAAVLESVRLVASPRGPFDPARLQATLSVAATDYAVLTVIAPALAKLQAAAPEVVLKLGPVDGESAMRLLDAGEIDLFAERLRNVDRVLAGQRVDDEKDF